MASWTVTKLIVEPSANGLKDVVAYVQWKVSHGKTVKFGTASLGNPDQEFIEYSNLTEQNVLNWVWSAVDKEAVESALVEPQPQIQPNTIVLPLPWA